MICLVEMFRKNEFMAEGAFIKLLTGSLGAGRGVLFYARVDLIRSILDPRSTQDRQDKQQINNR